LDARTRTSFPETFAFGPLGDVPMSAPVPPDPAALPVPVRKRRGTRLRVRVTERVSRVLITVGGLGTIVAVTTILVFLLVVVWPLFGGADVGEARSVAAAAGSERIVALGSDEYGLLFWTVRADGSLEVLGAGSGEVLGRRGLVEGAPPTAVAVYVSAEETVGALGFADGSARLFSLRFDTRLYEGAEVPIALIGLRPDERRVHEGGVAQRLATGEVRVQRLAPSVQPPLPVSRGAVARIDRSDVGNAVVLATMDAQGRAAIHRITETANRMNPGALPSSTRQSADLPDAGRPGGALPLVCGVPGTGDNVYLVWEDGRAQRFDCRNLDAPQLAESLDLLEDPGARVTAITWLLGKISLVVGDSTGFVRTWSRSKPQGEVPSTPDLTLLVANHVFPAEGSAVSALAASQRTKQFAVGRADGGVSIHNATGEKTLAELRATEGPVLAVALAPKEDALLYRTPRALVRRALDVGHPEASLRSLFGKVWYEGYDDPEYVWQSTGGTDDAEPKYSLMPLIFGTLKATFFSMLFGVPIALLAAVFTSEFLSARLRTSVKSVIEMMASLPSVVLGFLAAIVIAPFVQNVVPTVLTWFLLLPTLLLLGAHLWQLLPQHVTLRLAGAPRLGVMFAVFPLSILAAGAMAPHLESALFRGSLLQWLDHTVFEDELAASGWEPSATVPEDAREGVVNEAKQQALGKRPVQGQQALLTGAQKETVRAVHHAHAIGGWTYLLLPLAAVLVVLAVSRWLNPWLRARSGAWDRRTCALVALAKFLGGALVAVGVAWLLASVFTSSFGLDPRGSAEHATRGEGAWMGAYIQRNSLVVGFVMGFAIIPIIYTLAEDALSGVPQHLRLASLAAGATPWQTAVRVIIPTAMSGLFSAVMIGLGRAVGETMIVLMATGNTSIMEWNVFNGFRTLAANIATEMSEAVKDGTHYRILFLAAFALFAITFVLNTVAETVRQRFRKRAFQL
jgi:phosphate transport system permease protein